MNASSSVVFAMPQSRRASGSEFRAMDPKIVDKEAQDVANSNLCVSARL